MSRIIIKGSGSPAQCPNCMRGVPSVEGASKIFKCHNCGKKYTRERGIFSMKFVEVKDNG